ncbi:carbohydrate sulfotransferase 3-like [Branchiostoma floridae x Branchiostoma belcheri]
MLSLRRTKKLLLLLLVSGISALLYCNIVVFHLTPGIRTRLSPLRHTSSYEPRSLTGSPPRTAVLIVTQMRSGSSFVGELFNQHPDVFYVYEPLWALKNHPDKTHNVSEAEQLKLLQGILTCDFKNLVDLMPFYLNNKTFGAPTKSKVILKLCRSFKKLRANDSRPGLRCPIPAELLAEVLGRACRARRFTVIKTIRLTKISVLQPITEQNDLDLRVLHLVRDPRATIASRLALRHHRKDNVTTFFDDDIDDSEVDGLCDSILRNVHLKNVTASRFNERYTLLRFEDVAAAPVEKMRKLYQSLGVPLHKAVYRWVRRNTNASDPARAPFSTRRRSKDRTGGWRLALSFAQVKFIQDKCRQTLSLLGYRRVQSAEELVDTSINLYNGSMSTAL